MNPEDKVNNFLNVLKKMKNDYEERKVAFMEPKDNNGIGVSTCWTDDEGYETALLTNIVISVERYKTIEEAKEGHKKWAEYAKTTKDTKILRLGLHAIDSKDKIVDLIRLII